MFNEGEIIPASAISDRLQFNSQMASRNNDKELNELFQFQSSWFEERFSETEIICALPQFDEYDWESLFDFSCDEISIERQLSISCQKRKCFALGRFNDCSSELISHIDRYISTKVSLDSMPDEWDGDKVDENYNSIREVEKRTYRTRMSGAAGWMICNKNFRDERDQLKHKWDSLPPKNKPVFPFTQFPQIKIPPYGTQNVCEDIDLDFWKEYTGFCSRWLLSYMMTWELPVPLGPIIVDGSQHSFCQIAGIKRPAIPFHYPLLAEDGVNLKTRNKHNKNAEEHNFDDQKSWKTYSQILKINFWEQAISSRYSNKPKPKGFVMNLLFVLEDILGIDSSRIIKLRKKRNQFLSGKRDSLKGCR